MEKEETIELLKEIRDNTKSKLGFDIILSGRDTSLSSSFSPAVPLKGNYGIALDHISTYNSITNIDESNNVFTYHDGTGFVDIKIGPGSYEIDEINAEITRLMEANEDYDSVNDVPYVTIAANTSRLTSTIEIAPGYQVSVGASNTIGSILGFNQFVILNAGFHESPNPVNIIRVNSVLIHCDLVNSSYINGVKGNNIYSFPIQVSPGFRMTSHPSTLQYHKVVVDQLNTIKVWLTDESGQLLDLRNELVTIQLRLQEL